MNPFELAALSLALAMDAFAVAVTSGVILPQLGARRTLRLAWHFGFFQSAMTALGWLAGSAVRSLIEALDHWIAFGLLAFVGGRMAIEALKKDNGEDRPMRDPTKGSSLIVLSVATSIDALAVGLGLSVIGVGILTPSLVIGLAAFVLTAIGMHLGRLARAKFDVRRWAEGAGGAILLSIGVKILVGHGVFG